MSMQRFQGTGVALVTPFHADGSVDLEAFRAHVHRVVEDGVDFLVPCGTTGESATLADAEQGAVIRAAVEAAAGRVPVLAGAGTNSTSHAERLARAARRAGADGILSVTPYYNKPTQEGLFRHFQAVSQAARIPVILYNVPGRTSCNLLPETVLRLAELPYVAGVKEASGDLAQMATILAARPRDFVVLSGDDELTLPLLALGGDGVISVVANEAAAEMSALVSAGRSGNVAEARALHFRLLDLMRANFCETNPIPVKTALELLGGPPARFRAPLSRMGPRGRARLEAALRSAGLPSGKRDAEVA